MPPQRVCWRDKPGAFAATPGRGPPENGRTVAPRGSKCLTRQQLTIAERKHHYLMLRGLARSRAPPSLVAATGTSTLMNFPMRYPQFCPNHTRFLAPPRPTRAPALPAISLHGYQPSRLSKVRMVTSITAFRCDRGGLATSGKTSRAGCRAWDAAQRSVELGPWPGGIGESC